MSVTDTVKENWEGLAGKQLCNISINGGFEVLKKRKAKKIVSNVAVASTINIFRKQVNEILISAS